MSTTPLVERLRSLLSVVRFGQFASVGVVGAVCDNTVLLLSSELGIAAGIAGLLGVPDLAPEVAKALGIEAAIVVMFLLNDNWTFDEADGGGRSTVRRLLTSNLVRAAGIAVQLLVFSLVYRRLFVELSAFGVDLWLLVASLCGIGLGMCVNYVTESLVTWRVHESD
jgi:putative flippase GtrA